MKVLNYIETTVWAMLPSAYDKMHSIATRHSADFDRALIDAVNSQTVEKQSLLKSDGAKFNIASDVSIKPEAMLVRSGERLAGSRYVQMRDGVAIIDLNGVIAMRMNFFQELCEGGTSTELLAKDFQLCLDSPDVKSIVFLIHSPGGEAFGTHEFAQMVYAARGKKPIKAYIAGYGCSAAYFIAAAADEIIVDAQGMVGSIGVVSEWQDATQLYKNLGIDRRVYTSSGAPKKRLDMNKAEDEAEFVATLDAMENVFVKFVAKARSKTVEQVKNEFNQGGVLIGKDAVKAGMVDKVGSLEGVISELQKKPRNSNNSAKPKANNTGEEIDMGFKDDFKAFAQKLGFNVSESDETGKTESSVLGLEESAIESTGTLEEKPKVAEVPKTDLAAQLAGFKTEAGAFAVAEIKAGRLSPREKDDFVENYAQAAFDDSVRPLASGSRVERLKAQTANRKSSLLTEETINAETNQVLLAQSGALSSDEKKQRLLSATQLGKRTLELAKK